MQYRSQLINYFAFKNKAIGTTTPITTTATRFIIQGKSGNVGIGKNTPAKKLDVKGDANISGARSVASINTKVWIWRK